MSILHQFIQESKEMAATATNVVSFREARAKRIKELASQWAANTLSLGVELKEARDTFPVDQVRGATATRPGWSEWLEREVGIGERYARSLIQIHEKFGGTGDSIVGKASFKVLQYLARDTIPEDARQVVVERIEGGERIGRFTAEKIVKQHTAPPPEEARQIARETGKPTLARDGNIYLGGTKKQEQEVEARREIVYGVRRAIEELATMQITPAQFLKQAFKHQLWTVEEEHLIGDALDWLTDLKTAWEARR